MKKLLLCLTLFTGLTMSISAVIPMTVAAAERDLLISSFEPTSLIKSDGTYWTWSLNQSVPTQVHGLTDVKRTFSHNIMMKIDQTVWFWEQSSPAVAAQLTPLRELSNLVDIKFDYNYILALDAEGKVWIAAREFKDSRLVAPSFKLLSGIDNVASIEVYNEHHPNESFLRWVFLKRDGTVWADSGSLQSFEPITALGKISAIDSNLALKKDGTVWSWPTSFKGKKTSDPLTATQIKGLSGISSIMKNGNTNFAIDQQSRLWLWGATWSDYSNRSSTKYVQHVPVRIEGVANVAAAWMIETSIVAQTIEGNVYRTSNEWQKTPAAAKFSLIASDISEIKPGDRHLIMRNKNGTLWGWGVNKHSELGHGDYQFRHDTIVPVQKPISVWLNGQSVILNKGVITRGNQTYIPLRSVFEKLGAQTRWDENSKIVTISRELTDTTSLTITIDLKTSTATINNKPFKMPSKPFTVNGTAYLPLRFISETLGAAVDWVQKEHKIVILMQ